MGLLWLVCWCPFPDLEESRQALFCFRVLVSAHAFLGGQAFMSETVCMALQGHSFRVPEMGVRCQFTHPRRWGAHYSAPSGSVIRPFRYQACQNEASFICLRLGAGSASSGGNPCPSSCSAPSLPGSQAQQGAGSWPPCPLGSRVPGGRVQGSGLQAGRWWGEEGRQGGRG